MRLAAFTADKISTVLKR